MFVLLGCLCLICDRCVERGRVPAADSGHRSAQARSQYRTDAGGGGPTQLAADYLLSGTPSTNTLKSDLFAAYCGSRLSCCAAVCFVRVTVYTLLNGSALGSWRLSWFAWLAAVRPQAAKRSIVQLVLFCFFFFFFSVCQCVCSVFV